MLAHRASYDKKTLARQVIPLAPGYRTALSSCPEVVMRMIILINLFIYYESFDNDDDNNDSR